MRCIDEDGCKPEQDVKAIEERKRLRKRARWNAQPSKAPLDSQESCVVS